MYVTHLKFRMTGNMSIITQAARLPSEQVLRETLRTTVRR